MLKLRVFIADFERNLGYLFIYIFLELIEWINYDCQYACFICCCLMHYARHVNWKRSSAWTSKSFSWSSVFAAATTIWSGPRGPFLKGREAGTHLPLVIRPAYKASLILRRLHWPGIWRTETARSLFARGISCRRAEKEGKKKEGRGTATRVEKRSKHRPLTFFRLFLP